MPRLASATAVPLLFPGSTIACVAPGPTLTEAALEALRAAGVPVIAVNDAVRLAPDAAALYSSDREWWRFYDGVPAFGGLRVSVGPRKANASPIRVLSKAPIVVLEHTGEEGLEALPTGLRTGGNSGYAAVNLAVHLGARRILLVGYTLGPVGGRTHFFGRHPSGLNETQDAAYAAFRRAFATMIAPLRAAGVEVWNCTPGTRLEAFPRVDLAAALAQNGPAGVGPRAYDQRLTAEVSA